MGIINSLNIRKKVFGLGVVLMTTPIALTGCKDNNKNKSLFATIENNRDNTYIDEIIENEKLQGLEQKMYHLDDALTFLKTTDKLGLSSNFYVIPDDLIEKYNNDLLTSEERKNLIDEYQKTKKELKKDKNNSTVQQKLDSLDKEITNIRTLDANFIQEEGKDILIEASKLALKTEFLENKQKPEDYSNVEIKISYKPNNSADDDNVIEYFDDKYSFTKIKGPAKEIKNSLRKYLKKADNNSNFLSEKTVNQYIKTLDSIKQLIVINNSWSLKKKGAIEKLFNDSDVNYKIKRK
ncbi:MAG: hypothetical protein IKF19_05575 [Bacilli bacterium]|nr:hypothetical protein [Bacilli bacterium]